MDHSCNNGPDPIVCHCLGISRGDLVQALACRAMFSLKDICERTGAGDGCTACHQSLKQLLQQEVFTLEGAAKCG